MKKGPLFSILRSSEKAAPSLSIVESRGIDPVYEGLPVIVVADLTAVTPEFLEEEFERLKTKVLRLEKLQMKYRLDLLNGT